MVVHIVADAEQVHLTRALSRGETLKPDEAAVADAMLPADSASVGQRPTRVRYTVMIFLCVLAFLTYFDRVCISRAQDDIAHDLKIDNAKMGIIFGTFWFAYALFEIPGGWLADWFGARKALARIVLAWSLFTALSGTASGFYSLFMYRFLFGVGEAGAYPSMARVQSKWLPVHSRAWFGGILWMLSRWGAAFSPLIFGAMMRGFTSTTFRHFVASAPGMGFLQGIAPWRLGFWASGALGLIWVAAFYPWFRDEPEEKHTVNQAELDLIAEGRSPLDHTGEHDPKVLWKLFTSPAMWVVSGIGITCSFCFSFYMSWLPKYLKVVHHRDLSQSELLSAMPMLFAGLACLITGWLSDAFVRRTGRKRLGRAIFPMTGLLLAAVSLLTIRFARTPVEATVLMCVAAFAMDMNQACHWANIVDIGGRYAALAFGFMNMIGNIGNAAGPYIAAKIFESKGWNALFATYAAVFVVAAFFWLFNDPNKRFYVGAPGPSEPEPALDPSTGR